MGLADYYRTLGLRTGASFEDVKRSYRRLARRYHPDVNPDDRRAKERFIQATQAYEALLEVFQLEEPNDGPGDTAVSEELAPEPSPIQVNPSLSEHEQQLKQDSYQQLQTLLRQQKYPRAIALVDGLAQRLMQDAEVRQWQAITYQRYGRQLIRGEQLGKAKIYLDKALKIDPLNKSLWAEINRDFQTLAQRLE